MHAHAKGCKLYSGYYQKMLKGNFFKLVKSRFKKRVSELRQKGKTNV